MSAPTLKKRRIRKPRKFQHFVTLLAIAPQEDKVHSEVNIFSGMEHLVPFRVKRFVFECRALINSRRKWEELYGLATRNKRPEFRVGFGDGRWAQFAAFVRRPSLNPMLFGEAEFELVVSGPVKLGGRAR